MPNKRAGNEIGAKHLPLTLREAAQKWGVAEATVRQWIKRGKLPEAMPVGGLIWLIPHDTPKPNDKRYKKTADEEGASLPAPPPAKKQRKPRA